MAQLGIMIEGQMGLNWARWQKLCTAVESLGFDGLFRSDHFVNPDLTYQDALETWTALTYAASHTRRVQFGPLVTPITFRHPSLLAAMAVSLDELSKGRFIFGLGAGWNVPEHTAFGIPYPDDNEERFGRFEEGLEVIRLLLNAESPVSFEGKYFQLKGALLLPRPARKGNPPILIGGNGEKRTLPLVARYANEWNAVYVNAKDYRMLRRKLNGYLAAEGRSPAQLTYSMMTGLQFMRNPSVNKRIIQTLRAQRPETKTLTDAELITYTRSRGVIIGNSGEILEQIQELVDSGLSRLMLQWLDIDDLEGLELLSKLVLPAVRKMQPGAGV